MNETAAAPLPGATTAGRLLREARERQGLHIVALAAMIKVAPKKLEMLEADRLDALPDATFARALAQTVCRALKVDAGPVLALLVLAAAATVVAANHGRWPTGWTERAPSAKPEPDRSVLLV